MSRQTEKIRHLKPITSTLDFHAIYELGRHLSSKNKDFDMQPLSKIKSMLEGKSLDANTLCNNVKTFFLELATNVLTDQLEFPSLVIDFVLFDPADISGKRFYIAICSVTEDMIEKYKQQVQRNVQGDYPESRDEKRRPILTNPNIYSSPYFYKGPNERSIQTYKKFRKINAEQINVHFGSFMKREDNFLALETQANLIEEFFDLIQEELHTDQKNGKDIYEFNTSILVPLMRPAASYSGDDQNRLNGGGVFIYGQTKDQNNNDENETSAITESNSYLVKKAARLKYFFERKILETSHSFISLEKQTEIHNNLELNLFHHFGSNLRGLPEMISLENLGENNLTDWQKNVLSSTQEYLRNCLDNIYLVSNSYQEYLHRKDVKKIMYSKVLDLKEELERVKKKFKLHEVYKDAYDAIEIIVNEELLDRSTSIIPKVFGNTFDQFICNAVKEYKTHNIPQASWNIMIQLLKGVYVDHNGIEHNTFDVIFSNRETSFTSVVLQNAGLKPIKSKTSSGLGFYFLNFSLQILGALESNTFNRYFEIENTVAPKGISVSFKFKFHNDEK